MKAHDKVQERIEQCVKRVLTRREHVSELQRSIDAVCFPFVLIHTFKFPEELAQEIVMEFRREFQIDETVQGGA